MFLIERGELITFSPTTYTATVRLVSSLPSVVAGIPVSRGLDATDLVAGRAVAVAVFDAAAPTDAMVVGVH